MKNQLRVFGDIIHNKPTIDNFETFESEVMDKFPDIIRIFGEKLTGRDYLSKTDYYNLDPEMRFKIVNEALNNIKTNYQYKSKPVKEKINDPKKNELIRENINPDDIRRFKQFIRNYDNNLSINNLSINELNNAIKQFNKINKLLKLFEPIKSTVYEAQNEHEKVVMNNPSLKKRLISLVKQKYNIDGTNEEIIDYYNNELQEPDKGLVLTQLKNNIKVLASYNPDKYKNKSPISKTNSPSDEETRKRINENIRKMISKIKKSDSPQKSPSLSKIQLKNPQTPEKSTSPPKSPSPSNELIIIPKDYPEDNSPEDELEEINFKTKKKKKSPKTVSPQSESKPSSKKTGGRGTSKRGRGKK